MNFVKLLIINLFLLGVGILIFTTYVYFEKFNENSKLNIEFLPLLREIILILAYKIHNIIILQTEDIYYYLDDYENTHYIWKLILKLRFKINSFLDYSCEGRDMISISQCENNYSIFILCVGLVIITTFIYSYIKMFN